ncbi:MAG: hypothetical protein K8T25_15025 [Planctomycetia bacterium]|nr:hypothetical protein [Planctomycetia bacterium]
MADQVTLFITAPGAARGTPLKMLPDKTRAGMFAAQFVARSEGDYRLELSLPDGREEPLTKVFKVSTAALESRHPERNDDVLGKLARTTGGRYFIGLDAAMGRQSEPHVASLLKDRTQMTPVLGDRDPRWEAFWIRLMMFSVCGVLALEWLVRRLLKLA